MEIALSRKNNSKEIKGAQEQEEEIQMVKIENEAFEQATCVVSKDKKSINKR